MLVFGALALVRLSFHEPWRDELDGWLMARDTATWAEWLRVVGYGGHPYLWNLLIAGVQAVAPGFVALQALHAALVTLAVGIWTWRAPFPRAMRLLFVFGYFPFFEYCLLTRAYVVALLGCMVFASALSLRKYRLPLAVLGLALLVNSNFYAMLLACALVPLLWDPEEDAEGSPTLAAAVVGGLVVVTVLQVAPPADSGYAATWDFRPSLDHALGTAGIAWRALVPIPVPGDHFWGQVWLDGLPWLRGCLGLGALLGVALLLGDRPRLATSWVLGTGMLLAFCYSRFGGVLRHHGHVFLLLLVLFWRARETAGPSWRATGRLVLLWSLLLVHLGAGLYASVQDVRRPFTATREAALWLKQDPLLAGLPVLVHPSPMLAPVAYWLGRPVFFLAEGRPGSYMLWDSTPWSVAPGEVTSRALRRAVGGEAVLLVNEPLDRPLPGLDLVATFEESIVPDERVYVYRVRAPAQ